MLSSIRRSAAAVGFASRRLTRPPVGEFTEFVGNQQGSARGIQSSLFTASERRFSASAGYSFGSGQRLSEEAISNPADLFENDIFQSFFGQFEADLKTGTNVKTVFRLSPQATVFAIDPFQGRLAIYDPGLSVLVTQSLPNLGPPVSRRGGSRRTKPFRFSDRCRRRRGGLRLNSHRRALRGGILVRF